MYGSDGTPIINAGLPAAALTITAAGTWDIVAGVAVMVVGALGLLLAIRARGLDERTFG